MKLGTFWGCAFFLVIIVGRITQGVLEEEAKVVRKVPTTHKVVALTIDDGPHYKTTPELLAVLRQKQVKATLFVLGENAARNPELIAQAVADGHEIAAHGYSHKHLTKMTQAKCKEEFDKTERVITAVAPKPALFRPPGGLYNDVVLQEAGKKGYTTVLWSVDPHDWQRPPVAQVVSTVVNNIQPGGIVLLHDGQYPLPTPEAIGIIIDKLRADGYTLLTVGELLQYYEVRGVVGERL